MSIGHESRGNSTDRKRRKEKLLRVLGDGTWAMCFLQITDECPGKVSFDTLQQDRVQAGGPYRWGNVQPACAACNRRRSDKPIAPIKKRLVLAH